MNLGLLLGVSQVPVFSQAPLLVQDYRWSHTPPTYRRTGTPNWYRTHTVSKFGLQSSWITGAYHYTRLHLAQLNLHYTSFSELHFFTRDFDQYKNTLLSQLDQPPQTHFWKVFRNSFFIEHLQKQSLADVLQNRCS